MFKKFKEYFLASYNMDQEYILTHKAHFIFWIVVVFLPFLIILPFITLLTVGKSIAAQTSILVILQVFAMLSALYFLKKRKIRISSNIIVLSAFVVTVIGFFLRPAPLAGVSLAFYQLAITVFALFFCSYYFSILYYVLVFSSNVLYYFLVSLPAVKTADPLLRQIAVVQLIDMPIALTLTFLIGFFSTRFINNALALTIEQTKKTIEEAARNERLVETIKTVSDKIASSIKMTSIVISNFSDNAQTQSASVEQLSATMDEISAGTTSTTEATNSQNNSIHDLVSSIDKLAASIDEMEHYGTQISEVITDFLTMAKSGEQSSAKLDETNRKITSSSNEILSVITIIEEFFDKIKMLSLNATIEAARAGDYGRGFAVVAAEIGKLSDDSVKELTQISELIEKNKTDVETGNLVINDIISFIKTLLSNTADIQDKTQIILTEIMKQKKFKDEMNSKTQVVRGNAETIAHAMGEQKHAIEDVVSSIAVTHVLVQQNADNTAELSSNSSELEQLAEMLTKEFNAAR